VKKLLGAVLSAMLIPAAVLAAEAPAAAAPAATEEASVVEAAPANAAADVISNTPEAEAARSGFRLDATLEQYVGSGTFVNPDYYGAAGASLDLIPSYSFKVGSVKLKASLREVFSFEYLRPIDSPTGRRFDLSDTRLALSAPTIFTEERFTGISLTPGISMTLPLSWESRLASTITRLGVSAKLSRSLWKFDLIYTLGGSRGIHSNPAKMVTASTQTDQFGNPTCLARAGSNYCSTAGINSAWGITNGLAVTFRATEKLSFDASYDIANYWTYGIPEDEFTPKATDVNGNPVARSGMGRADEASMGLSASYALTDMFALNAGVATLRSAPRTDDGKAFRFPLIDFIGPAENRTSYSVSLSATF
jgi:hypothetical protein